MPSTMNFANASTTSDLLAAARSRASGLRSRYKVNSWPKSGVLGAAVMAQLAPALGNLVEFARPHLARCRHAPRRNCRSSDASTGRSLPRRGLPSWRSACKWRPSCTRPHRAMSSRVAEAKPFSANTSSAASSSSERVCSRRRSRVQRSTIAVIVPRNLRYSFPF